jgi:hypothetical protein
MCKEMPGIPINRVVDPKRIIKKSFKGSFQVVQILGQGDRIGRNLAYWAIVYEHWEVFF